MFIYISVCIVLSCFGTIRCILAHPDQQRSQIHYCSTKEAETGKCVKIPLACSKGAILQLKSEWPVLRGVPLHGKRKCLSNCIKVPVSPCMWTHTQPQGGEAKNLLLANAKPFGDDPIRTCKTAISIWPFIHGYCNFPAPSKVSKKIIWAW